jgi:CelD/BcsL family acetyltransferase involved in cellulose biosynthesis
VIIGEDALGAAISFLPVQFRKRTCRPAGSPAADFQGPICAPGVEFDIEAAVSACGTAAYHFDHMRDGMADFEPWIFNRRRSPHMDISGGMEGYLSRASRSGKDNIAQARRLKRKAEREHGPVRFDARSADVGLLDTVIALKRHQYSATGSRDYFSHVEHADLLHRLLDAGGVEFGGMLSAIYAGPHLLAAHFGLRAGPVLHWWFPVYVAEFARLSPGWMLLRAIIDSATDLGLARIDLGRGDDEYKRRAMTGYQVVCEGAVIRHRLHHRAVLARRSVVATVKSSRAAPALGSTVRYAGRRSR